MDALLSPTRLEIRFRAVWLQIKIAHRKGVVQAPMASLHQKIYQVLVLEGTSSRLSQLVRIELLQ